MTQDAVSRLNEQVRVVDSYGQRLLFMFFLRFENIELIFSRSVLFLVHTIFDWLQIFWLLIINLEKESKLKHVVIS